MRLEEGLLLIALSIEDILTEIFVGFERHTRFVRSFDSCIGHFFLGHAVDFC